jgi:hypothetical protein
MAQDFKSVITRLNGLKPKIEKIAKNNDLISVIDEIGEIIDDASGTGAIGQIVPVRLKAQYDTLEAIRKQLKQTAEAASKAIEQIADDVCNIPVGQLIKKPLKSVAEDEDDNEYANYIDTTPDTSHGAQSAIRNESTSLAFDDKETLHEEYVKSQPSTNLHDYFKEQFKENKKMKSASGFSFDNIKSDFSSRANELGKISQLSESGRYAPANDMSDIFAKLNENVDNDNQSYVDDEAMEFEESSPIGMDTAGGTYDWRRMAESAGADMMRDILGSSPVSRGASDFLNEVGDAAGDAISAAKRG